MDKIDVYESSDYAGCSDGTTSFYYGYEKTMCTLCGRRECDCQDREDNEEWAFEAKNDRERISISFSNLGAEDQFNTTNCLINGIMIYTATRSGELEILQDLIERAGEEDVDGCYALINEHIDTKNN